MTQRIDWKYGHKPLYMCGMVYHLKENYGILKMCITSPRANSKI